MKIGLFDEAVNARFDTVLRNIKSISNSFYDSYLDLLETTIKFILEENNIEYDTSRTCGYLVKEEKIKNYFMNNLKVDEIVYKKLPDYIKKCNDHKHKKEKKLGIESVVNYLTIYFEFINYYAKFEGKEALIFDKDYYISIFGENEKINLSLKEEVQLLKNELSESYEDNKLSMQDIEKYKSIISSKDIELLNLDEQNNELQKQVSTLKDIKLSSMEHKLNKTIDMLNNLQEYLIESRAATSIAVRLISGDTLTEKDLKVERERMEKLNNE